METVIVTVPNDALGTFTFEYNGKAFEVDCPEGCGPGTEITVQLPAPPKDEPASTAKLETQDVMSEVASHVADTPTLVALSLTDKTSHEATAPAMAKERYRTLKPTSVNKDREPHRWGVGGPPPPGHGALAASELAKAALQAGVFSLADLKLDHDSKSEVDEGDYDVYMKHKMTFQGQQVWSLETSCHSNIGGSWGTGSSCDIQGDKLFVSLSHCGRRVGGGHDASEERTYELKDILIGAAIKAGAMPPVRPDTIYIQP